MREDLFLDIVIVLLVAIIVIGLLGSLTSSRFTNTKHKDKFRTKGQIGKHNIGKMKKQKTYRELAKDRNLDEATKLEPKMNPKVTRSVAQATKDIRKNGNKDRR